MVGNGAKPQRNSSNGDADFCAAPVVDVAQAVQTIVGCKWAIQILGQIRSGVQRPGALQRNIPGLSTKVMNERLARMQRFEILERVSHPEVPPRVEYHLTEFGRRFLTIIDAVETLQSELDAAPPTSAE